MTPSKIDWSAARLDYERGGTSQAEIARRHGVSRRAVQKRIEREGWTQELRRAIARETQQRLLGITATDDPAKREKLLDQEAAKRAELIKRHRLEWDFLRTYTATALAQAAKVENGVMVLATADAHQEAARHMRFAKLATLALADRQEAERVAFGLDEQPDDADNDMSVEHAAIRIAQIFNAAGIDPAVLSAGNG
jgi:hypothetical protein